MLLIHRVLLQFCLPKPRVHLSRTFHLPSASCRCRTRRFQMWSYHRMWARHCRMWSFQQMWARIPTTPWLPRRSLSRAPSSRSTGSHPTRRSRRSRRSPVPKKSQSKRETQAVQNAVGHSVAAGSAEGMLDSSGTATTSAKTRRRSTTMARSDAAARQMISALDVGIAELAGPTPVTVPKDSVACKRSIRILVFIAFLCRYVWMHARLHVCMHL